MRNRLFKMGAGLAALAAVVLSSTAAPPLGMKTLSGHVPAVVSHLQSKGLLAATNRLYLALGLPLRNQEALTNLLQQIYDPASPNYHHYLTPEQFTAQFGPTEEDYQKVINFAQAGGLTVVGTHPNRMLLDVAGSAAEVEKAFNVTLRTYHHPTENRDFFAPDTEPSVPSTLPVLDISGLNNYWTARPKLKVMKMPTVAASHNGSGVSGTYLGDDFRNAYVPGSALNGAGQTVGLFEEDGYYPSDIVQYEILANRTNVPLQNVLIDGVSGVPGYSGFPTANEEVALDIEMVIAMAPAVSKIIVYEGPIFSGQNDILNRMATDNAAKQLSSSWGWSGGPSATTDQIFKQMALQGQTFFDASGDSDAFTAGANSVNGVDNPNTYNAPSDNPYITQVGGTTLTMNGKGASYASETVWNWDVEFGSAYDGEGSSGGISSYYSIPWWQTNINVSASKGSASFRNTPDVAAVADNIMIVADDGYEESVGGTSAAAPLWAGFTALVNQQAANNGNAAVGFINPALYAIASGPNYASCFHDITTGNNEWSASPNLFSAVPNYDLCTGLGTPNGANLINALAASTNVITRLSPPTPPYGSSLTALNGANPNGTWNLYELDDGVFDTGVISNGWILALTTANPVGAAADNFIKMTGSAGTIPVGGNGVYVLTVTNYGPSVSSNVLVSDTLPLGAPLISSNVPPGTTISRSGNQLFWHIGTLNTNAGAQLTLTVQAVSGGSLVNSAIVSADTADPNPGDNFDSYTINAGIVPPPQFSSAVALSGGKFQFSVASQPNQTNEIQWSTNLVNWFPLYTNVGPFSFTNTIAPGYPVQFYRDLILGP
jgi:uncharacterized repeat protein (TIGR01451 family)